MKRLLLSCFVVLTVFFSPSRLNAQSDFFFNCYGGSTNLWSAMWMQLPTSLINGLLFNEILEEGESGGYNLRYDFLTLKDDGEKLKIDHGKLFGFKAKDMFRNFQYGLKVGWQPQLSPFGVFVSCAYQHRQFDVRFDKASDEWSEFRLNYIRPGIGIRITPLIGLLENEGWSPIIEIGTAYNYNFSCKAPYENSKDQLNDGFTSTFGLGVRFEEWSITGGVEMDNYSLLNKDYTPDGGLSFPYKDIKSSHVTAFLTLSRDF